MEGDFSRDHFEVEIRTRSLFFAVWYGSFASVFQLSLLFSTIPTPLFHNHVTTMHVHFHLNTIHCHFSGISMTCFFHLKAQIFANAKIWKDRGPRHEEGSF